MKITVFSDLHVDNFTKYSEGTQRLTDCLKAFLQIVSFSVKKGVSKIAFCGDFFDKTHSIEYLVFYEVIKTFKLIQSEYTGKIKIYAITGNHGHYTKNLIDNAASKSLKVLEVLFPDILQIIDNTIVQFDSINLVGVPYYSNKKDYEKALKKVLPKNKKQLKKTILLNHQTPILNDIPIGSDLNQHDKIYSSLLHTFCGHIHKYEKLTKNFTIVGNPLILDRSDLKQKKGFLIFDTKTKKSKFIQLKINSYLIDLYNKDSIKKDTQDLEEDITTLDEINADDVNDFFKAFTDSENLSKEIIKEGLKYL